MTIFYWLAAMMALTTAAVHIFAGGRVVARPILDNASLSRPAKWLAYYCWHITTLAILLAMAAFGAVALDPGQSLLAQLMTGFCLALSMLSIAIAVRAGINPLRFPSTSLFAATGLLGAAGLTL